MLEAWSRTRDGTRKLSANFTVAEFACKDGSDPVFVDSSLAALLQKIREHFGRRQPGEERQYIRLAYSGIEVADIREGLGRLNEWITVA